MLNERSLVLVPDQNHKAVAPGDCVKIRRPDQTVIEASILGINFTEFRDIIVDGNLAKEDIPVGSEVWLNKA